MVYMIVSRFVPVNPLFSANTLHILRAAWFASKQASRNHSDSLFLIQELLRQIHVEVLGQMSELIRHNGLALLVCHGEDLDQDLS